MSEKESKHHAIIMIGAGPASLAAAVYTTREKIDTLLLEKGIIGGYAAITDKVDNYPGFPDGIAGLELSERLEKQARRFGAKIDFGEVVGLEEKDGKRVVKTQDGDYTANAVLIATGTDHKHLGIPGEEEYYGRGVHYCATCDGAFYKDKHLVVVGGGNSAAQESLFLTRFASKIDILVRDGWVASEVLVEKVKANEKISVHMGWETLKITADDHGLVNAIDARELE
ncbi:MAG: FAD-dependent oxidoreductase, partial [Candidatus Saccharimonadales bacterium]|nr:FAD-dependent oxidoreductase [Candidatus Saccharimonadales bacterium]